MSFDPYAPPSPDSFGRDARPRVILWFRVYSAVMMLVSLGFLGLAVLMGYAATRPEVAIDANAAGAPLAAIVLALLSAALVALYGVATFVPFKPWGWTVGLVAIALGLAGGSVIFAIPLLVHWLKPQVRAAFARF
ncbi:MAG: hypothetical protein QOI41_854 [Myxococcales bacterium]|nr:hypothetical protein [Myxococcales bacterium]